MNKKPAVLLILDGLGLREEKEGNAVAAARTPVLDRLMADCPFVKGYASGESVGLPEGQMGNSEVGHLNMGAGRIIYQELTHITNCIKDGSFFEIPEFKECIENCRKYGSDLHLFGLLSDGGVHSHIGHLYGLLELARKNNIKNVFVHCFMDGRDTPPESGINYIRALESEMDRIGVGRIASVSGRYYAMDRDKNYDRTEKAYRALVMGEGVKAGSAEEAVLASYKNGVTDEFILPTVIMDGDRPTAVIKEHDSVIFFNFRPDRARQITRAFCDEDFPYFDRGNEKRGPRVDYVCFTDYDETITDKGVAFKKTCPANTFGEYISSLGKRQLRIAETEKYAHVTFFFNGGREEPYEFEDRILIPSRKDVATYDLLPEMSAYQVCDKLCDAIEHGGYDAVICNLANPDMVGHTGVMEAAIKAVEVVDECLGRICSSVKRAGGVMFICADHGNVDTMVYPGTDRPHTSHTTSPVPFILYNADKELSLREGGVLSDIAPTMLELMGLDKPAEMTAGSLIIRK